MRTSPVGRDGRDGASRPGSGREGTELLALHLLDERRAVHLQQLGRTVLVAVGELELEELGDLGHGVEREKARVGGVRGHLRAHDPRAYVRGSLLAGSLKFFRGGTLRRVLPLRHGLLGAPQKSRQLKRWAQKIVFVDVWGSLSLKLRSRLRDDLVFLRAARARRRGKKGDDGETQERGRTIPRNFG